MATRKRLFVSPDGQRWKVQWEGGSVDTYHSTQDAAIKRARAVVGSLPQGECSQIMVQRPNGQWVTEWTYGSDPFPPRG